jgi:hypothetical protein
MAQLYSRYTSGVQFTAGPIVGSVMGVSGLNPIVDRLNSITSDNGIVSGTTLVGYFSGAQVIGSPIGVNDVANKNYVDNTILSYHLKTFTDSGWYKSGTGYASGITFTFTGGSGVLIDKVIGKVRTIQYSETCLEVSGTNTGQYWIIADYNIPPYPGYITSSHPTYYHRYSNISGICIYNSISAGSINVIFICNDTLQVKDNNLDFKMYSYSTAGFGSPIILDIYYTKFAKD